MKSISISRYKYLCAPGSAGGSLSWLSVIESINQYSEIVKSFVDGKKYKVIIGRASVSFVELRPARRVSGGLFGGDQDSNSQDNPEQINLI